MFTRISSAFRLLIRLGFAVLLLGGTVQAQHLDLIWERRGEGSQSRYGGTMFGLGDRNHDGYDDFAVHAWGWGEVGNASEATLELFYGGNPPSTEPFYTFRGILEEGLTIWGATEIGDIDGDGLMDWIIGYRSDDYSERWNHYYIGATCFPALPIWILPYHDEAWNLDVTPKQVGDVNGDGFDEIYFLGLGSGISRGAMWFGSAEPDSTADWEIQSLNGYYVWPSNSGREDGIGDLNGDGFDDILNRMWWDHGPFEVFWGGELPAVVSDTIGFNPYGNQLAHIARDLNGDGRDDLVLPMDTMHTAVFLGGEVLSPEADFILLHPGCGVTQGAIWKTEAVGDLNGDGYQELAVTNNFCPSGRGTIWLYFGQNWLNPNPVFTFQGWQFDTWGLREAARVGDVNGDGIDDLGIGGFDNADFRGWAGILAGNPDIVVSADDPPAPLVKELELKVYPNPFNATLSITLTTPLHQDVTVSLYDLLGREVDVLQRGRLSSTTFSYATPATLASGLYFLRAQTQTQSVMQKVVLLK